MSRSIAQGLLSVLTTFADALERAQGRQPIEAPSIDDPESMEAYARELMARNSADEVEPGPDAIPYLDVSNLVSEYEAGQGEN